MWITLCVSEYRSPGLKQTDFDCIIEAFRDKANKLINIRMIRYLSKVLM